MPAFDDMEEPKVEIAVWTTDLEDSLKKVTEELMADEGELSPKVLDANMLKYKKMMSNLDLRDLPRKNMGRLNVWGSHILG